MRTKSNRGRPAYNPTTADRRKVANAAGGGMTHEEIAIALGICRNTLEKNFEVELSKGALDIRAKVLDAMVKTALKGNVSAQKAYLAMSTALAAPPVANEHPPEKLGKKDKANADAASAAKGTGWEDLIDVANVTPIRKQA